MEVTKESLLKIRSYISDKDKLDIKLYDTVIEILRNDSLFNNPIKCERKDDDIPASIEATEGVLRYSDCVLQYAKNFYEHFAFLPFYNEQDAYNYKLLFTLLHELAHLKQLDYAKDDNGIIGDIYRNVLFSDNINEDHYRANPYDYVFEYNADMEAMKIIRKIYQGNMFLTTLNGFELMGLLTNCYYDGESFIAEKTYRLLNLDDSEVKKVHDKPVDILIHNGLPVNEEVLDDICGNPMESIIKYNL